MSAFDPKRTSSTIICWHAAGCIRAELIYIKAYAVNPLFNNELWSVEDYCLEQRVVCDQPPIDCYDDGLRPWAVVRPGRLG
jgi:hypothetical protein